jgi:tripartite-type tricarboxylate transporter receptor subunit TctC
MQPPSDSVESRYPQGPVDLVVPFPPGGVTDIAARAVAGFLTARWHSPVTVSHVAGDGGATGTLKVLRSRPDGLTLLMCATGQATQNPALRRDHPYRWDEPTPVARVVASPLVFVVSGRSRWTSLRELMGEIQRDPAAFAYGTSGVGGIGSIATARLLHAAGIDPLRVRRVVMHGGSGMLESVAHGKTHFAVQYLAEMKGLLDAGDLKPLVVSGSERVSRMPDVMTGREAGFDAFDLTGWSGVAGPAGLPAEIIGKWTEALKALTDDAGFRSHMEELGGRAAYLGPVEFKATLADEFATALKFAEMLGLRV